MNIRSFLYSLCQKALEIDNSIKFVGVVNADGKLIVGTNKQHQIDKENRLLDKDFFKNRLRPLTYNILVNDPLDRNMTINKNAVFHSKAFEISDFQLICIGENTFIAFAPLTEDHDKFICIYFRMYGSINDVLSKLDTIFEYGE